MDTYYYLIISIIIIGVGWMIYKMKWVSQDAILALWLIGMAAALNGFFWLFPLGFFLVTGSILTKLQTEHKRKIKSKEKAARNWKQLFANGLTAAVFAILYFLKKDPVFYYLYITAIAVNLFDTWCAEIGTLIPTKTFSLYRLQEVQQGASGGITLMGTLGGVIGLLGYLVMVFLLGLLQLVPQIDGQVLGLIFMGGTAGGFFDSILGIFENEKGFEADYKLIRKIPWLKNNMVNFLSSIFGSLIFAIVYFIEK